MEPDTANIVDEANFAGKEENCKWWRKKSATTQCVICLLPMFFLLVGLVIFATLFGLEYAKNDSNKSNKSVCMTADCVTAGGQMLMAMDQTVDPCDDFYTYACGGFEKKQTIPPGKNKLQVFDQVETVNRREVKKLLEAKPVPKESEARSKARKYYLSCLDRKTVNKNSVPEMRKIVKDMGGLFLNSSVPKNWSLDALLAKRNKYSTAGLFAVGAGADDKNVFNNIIQISQGGLGLGGSTRDYYLNKSVTEDATLNAYAKMLATYSELILNDTIDMEMIYDVVRFEQQLAGIQLSQAAMRDVSSIYNKVDILWLQQKVPFMNWLNFFNNLLKVAKSNATVNETEPVLLYSTPYIKALSQMIETMDKNVTTLQNYIVLHTINAFGSSLGDDFQKAYYEFQAVFVGAKGVPETWQPCFEDTDSNIGFPVGAMYVDSYFGERAKQKASDVIDGIIASFRKRVETIDWMDKDTKKHALGKLDFLKHDVAFPDWISNDTYLNEKYASFNVSGNYVENLLSAHRFALFEFAKKLRSPVDSKRWDMTPPTVNAYYEPTQNKFVVPAGILNPVFFFKANGIPDVMNYAGIGSVAGHEITHGFDDQGAQYDQYGNLKNWWNNQTAEKFKQRTKCVVSQYNKYEANGLHLRGKQTLGENIADNGGIRTSFQAYKMAQDAGKLNLPQLIGVNLTADQLFFVGYAQVWCSVFTPEAMKLQILGNPHSPARFRVLGSLSNSPDFANAYKCPVGSNMNPKSKCTVW